jgi:hypothetical protein
VRHIRGLMGAGASANCVRKQLLLDAQYFLMNNKKRYDWFASQVPKLRWFQYQREGFGAEAYLYTWIQIAKAESIFQWGFDETGIDGVATLNQWAMIQEEDDTRILTLECAGLLLGSDAEAIAEHVRVSW